MTSRVKMLEISRRMMGCFWFSLIAAFPNLPRRRKILSSEYKSKDLFCFSNCGHLNSICCSSLIEVFKACSRSSLVMVMSSGVVSSYSSGMFLRFLTLDLTLVMKRWTYTVTARSIFKVLYLPISMFCGD